MGDFRENIQVVVKHQVSSQGLFAEAISPGGGKKAETLKRFQELIDRVKAQQAKQHETHKQGGLE